MPGAFPRAAGMSSDDLYYVFGAKIQPTLYVIYARMCIICFRLKFLSSHRNGHHFTEQESQYICLEIIRNFMGYIVERSQCVEWDTQDEEIVMHSWALSLKSANTEHSCKSQARFLS